MTPQLRASDLLIKRCMSCNAGTQAIPEDIVRNVVADLPGWEVMAMGTPEIAKTYHFKNYHETMAFVNAVAWLSHREDHHPDMEVGYNRCRVRYSTHAIGGISENDLICAAKVESLML